MLTLQWFIQHSPNAFGMLFLLVLMCCYCLVMTFTDMETSVGPIVSSFIVMNYLTMKYPHCLKVNSRGYIKKLMKRYGYYFRPEWAVVNCSAYYRFFGTVGSFLGTCIWTAEEIGYG